MREPCKVCGDPDAPGGICSSCLSAAQAAIKADERQARERVQAAIHFFTTPVGQVIQQTIAKHRLMYHLTKHRHKEAPHD